jgi:hypothetical protein
VRKRKGGGLDNGAHDWQSGVSLHRLDAGGKKTAAPHGNAVNDLGWHWQLCLPVFFGPPAQESTGGRAASATQCLGF